MSTEFMQAVRFHQFGETNQLVLEQIPQPNQPGEGEVMIRVHAAGVNPFDSALRRGYMQNYFPINLPATPGLDVSGVIAEVGPGVTEYRTGQAVFGLVFGDMAHGSYAEYALTSAYAIQPKPHNLDFQQAASVSHGFRTAWSALFEQAGLQPGQRVLIHGGAGGVGLFAVQIAHYIGAQVVSTASSANVDFVRSLGADEVIDYTNGAFEEQTRDLDVVFDTVGGDVLTRSWQTLKPGGFLVSALEFPSPELAAQHGVRSGMVGMSQNLAFILQKAAELTASGAVKPYVRAVFPLSQAAQAAALSETRHGRGRIILQVAQ